jgi:hypothetical protein
MGVANSQLAAGFQTIAEILRLIAVFSPEFAETRLFQPTQSPSTSPIGAQTVRQAMHERRPADQRFATVLVHGSFSASAGA